MKKSISVLFLFLLLLANVLPVQAGNGGTTEISASVKNNEIVYTGDGADVFRVAVNLSLGKSENGIASYVVTVSWDPDVLELVSGGCYFTDIRNEGWDMIPDASTVVNTKDSANGSLTVSSGSVSNRSKAEGTLFLLEFRPKNVTAQTTITVKPGSKNISADKALASADGLITDIKKESSLTFQVRGDGITLGDINGDGIIDAKDYIILKRHVLGTYTMTEAETLCANVNGDEIIDARDYIAIKRHVLGTYTIR